MKVLSTILLLAIVAAAQAGAPEQTGTTPAALQTSIPTDQANAKKARALLDQMTQALGGPAYLNVQDMLQEGRTYSFHHGEPTSTGILFWRFYKYPDKERVEVTKQRDVAYVFNGDKGYEITYKGTTEQDPKQVAEFLRRRAHSLEWVVRKWLTEPGVALFYDGAAVAAEKPADQITIMRQDDSVTFYLDTNTHLPIKKSYSWRDALDKLRNTEDEIYDNYRPTQGIMTPFSITRFLNGDMSNQRFLNVVKYNTSISDSFFDASIRNEPSKPNPKKH
jgi:hypothetical protein